MNNKNEKKQIIVQCYNCGNKGLMNVLYTTSQKFGGTYENKFGEIEHDLEEEFNWKLLSCPVCNMLTLYQSYTNESMLIPYGEKFKQIFDSEILYPKNKMKMNGVPKDISSAFESALKIKNIDYNICLFSLRRTLEMICIDKKAKGRNLYEKIMYLIKEKIFPQELEDAYFVIKNFGNDGAHCKNTFLNIYEIEELIEILYKVIDYLYIMPKMIEKMKKTYEEKSEAKKND